MHFCECLLLQNWILYDEFLIGDIILNKTAHESAIYIVLYAGYCLLLALFPDKFMKTKLGSRSFKIFETGLMLTKLQLI